MEENLWDDFKEIIDLNFSEYEDSGYDEDVLCNLRNNIAKKMLDVYKAQYGKESEMYNNCTVGYMNSINDCLKSYKKIPFSDRKAKFSAYFFPILRKTINEYCRLERESGDLDVTFGEETEKSCSARRKLRRIKKLYNEIKEYDNSLTDGEIFQKIAYLENTKIERINQFKPYIHSSHSVSADGSVYDINQKNSSPIDIEYIKNTGDKPSLDRPEDLVISMDNMKSILDKINDVYKNQKDKECLSKVITFKILDSFEVKQKSSTNNTSGRSNCISYLPESYDLKELLSQYDFIEKKMLSDYFTGVFLEQNELDKELGKGVGCVINTWKRFNGKLLKKYRPELEEMRDS